MITPCRDSGVGSYTLAIAGEALAQILAAGGRRGSLESAASCICVAVGRSGSRAGGTKHKRVALAVLEVRMVDVDGACVRGMHHDTKSGVVRGVAAAQIAGPLMLGVIHRRTRDLFEGSASARGALVSAAGLAVAAGRRRRPLICAEGGARVYGA